MFSSLTFSIIMDPTSQAKNVSAHVYPLFSTLSTPNPTGSNAALSFHICNWNYYFLPHKSLLPQPKASHHCPTTGIVLTGIPLSICVLLKPGLHTSAKLTIKAQTTSQHSLTQNSLFTSVNSKLLSIAYNLLHDHCPSHNLISNSALSHSLCGHIGLLDVPLTNQTHSFLRASPFAIFLCLHLFFPDILIVGFIHYSFMCLLKCHLLKGSCSDHSLSQFFFIHLDMVFS